MDGVLTVTQFVQLINEYFDALTGVIVQGEVDQFKIIQNKWVTFSLKDETSCINCFIPIWQFRTQVENGMLVRAVGRPALRNKGFFSFVLSNVQPAGEGALKRAFELLKNKLTEEGLFAPERKRALPRFPQHIALITSKDAAAYSDFLKVLKARQGGLQISFLHTQVQGEPAPMQILAALEYANTHLEKLDAIVLVRGGGSMEDLQAFNDERVVRAVAASRTPTVVGIGHERDITLAELASDVRASTPSNAAELLVQSRQEIFSDIQLLSRHLTQLWREAIAAHSHSIDHGVNIVCNVTSRYDQRLTDHTRLITDKMRLTVQNFETRLDHTARLLSSFSPQNILKRGYSITRTKNGQLIKSSTAAPEGAEITTQLARGVIHSRVEKG